VHSSTGHHPSIVSVDLTSTTLVWHLKVLLFILALHFFWVSNHCHEVIQITVCQDVTTWNSVRAYLSAKLHGITSHKTSALILITVEVINVSYFIMFHRVHYSRQQYYKKWNTFFMVDPHYFIFLCQCVQIRCQFFFWCNSPSVGQGLLIHEVSRSHTMMHHSR